MPKTSVSVLDYEDLILMKQQPNIPMEIRLKSSVFVSTKSFSVTWNNLICEKIFIENHSLVWYGMVQIRKRKTYTESDRNVKFMNEFFISFHLLPPFSLSPFRSSIESYIFSLIKRRNKNLFIFIESYKIFVCICVCVCGWAAFMCILYSSACSAIVHSTYRRTTFFFSYDLASKKRHRKL